MRLDAQGAEVFGQSTKFGDWKSEGRIDYPPSPEVTALQAEDDDENSHPNGQRGAISWLSIVKSGLRAQPRWPLGLNSSRYIYPG